MNESLPLPSLILMGWFFDSTKIQFTQCVDDVIGREFETVSADAIRVSLSPSQGNAAVHPDCCGSTSGWEDNPDQASLGAFCGSKLVCLCGSASRTNNAMDRAAMAARIDCRAVTGESFYVGLGRSAKSPLLVGYGEVSVGSASRWFASGTTRVFSFFM